MDKSTQLYYLKLLGIQTWQLRENSCQKSETMKKSATKKPVSEMNWEELDAAVAKCKLCDLYKTRTHAVFGVGDKHASVMIIGEAPGANEDKQGEPFVGRGGRLLNSMLHSIGLARDKVYIANILKSRPPDNRDPTPEEVSACTPYLQRQIALVKPKLILAVGRIAAHHLLNTDLAMGQLRGREFTYGEQKIPLIVTYHPAYLLRSPREKRKAWEDMDRVAKFLAEKA